MTWVGLQAPVELRKRGGVEQQSGWTLILKGGGFAQRRVPDPKGPKARGGLWRDRPLKSLHGGPPRLRGETLCNDPYPTRRVLKHAAGYGRILL